MKYTLKLNAQMAARSGSEYGSGKTFLYDVNGLPEGQKITIKNISPDGQTPVWQTGCYMVGQETKWTGAFNTPDEALAQLQKDIDAADNATPEQITAIAEAAGWKAAPAPLGTNALVFTIGPMMLRVSPGDRNWVYWSEVFDGAAPDARGNGVPSLIAFFSSHDKFLR
jgi:hypothetical protein